jgi:IS5 family transposase
MKPRKPERNPQENLFKVRLDVICDHANALKKLADCINWEFLDEQLGDVYSDRAGRPPLPTRLMVGIHYLKHAFNLSDEDSCREFIENPYWQYFCGLEFFEHELPFDRSSMTRWRERLGPEKMEKLLKETFQVALRSKFVKASEIKKVIVDTTVQEKAVAFPTDSKLYFKATRALVRIAREAGISLRQSYVHVTKKMLFGQARYSNAKQMKRANKCKRKLHTILGRIIRDIERKLEVVSNEVLKKKLTSLLGIARRVFTQKRSDSRKIYSIHAPEVECIAKGKAHRKYEFGCKVSMATTFKSSWVVGADAVHDNPFDGHTLKAQIDQIERITGQRPEQAFVDQGYRGVKNHPEDLKTHICGKKTKDTSLKKAMRRRSSIEPIIGHTKSDNRMDRNYLKGRNGDRINAMLAASGRNLRKWMAVFLFALFGFRLNFQFRSLRMLTWT